MYNIKKTKDGVSVYADEKLIIEHSCSKPAVFLGKGEEEVKMYRGNFDIKDNIREYVPLKNVSVSKDCIVFSDAHMDFRYTLSFHEENGILKIQGHGDDKRYNRIFLRIFAEEKEHVCGGGEQFSALDLRGKVYPVWTREQGVGRNKETEITKLADAQDGSGGDYHTTFYPQPTFMSSRMYFLHIENYCYQELDFRNKNYHELVIWDTDVFIDICSDSSFPRLVTRLTGLLGRQPKLPPFAMKGLWLGVQGGTKRATDLLEKCQKGGLDVSAVWIQDWEGKRITSFGKRLQWDWRWNKELYPGLDKLIKDSEDTAWMGYINPYLIEGGVLFAEALEKNFFVKNPKGDDYLFDFGEYNCGVVDLTNPAAFDWYKEVIKTNLIDFGFKGWMADFGEYLPYDAVCFRGSGDKMHNLWPLLWAKCNRMAVEEKGMLGKCVFFMRAGAGGSGAYSTLVWAGDQCVDWSFDDGLPSVITAALSLGMSGFGLHTCDAGGYTTLFYLKRDKELLLRWLEFACFTPVMRTHEGNRPDDNVQIYQDDDIIKKAARLVDIHNELYPYLTELAEENADKGIPVMRPLFFENPEDERAYERDNFSYMLGDELLVAPVISPSKSTRKVWLPKGTWVHLWSGMEYGGGEVAVNAPLGYAPVFYKKFSLHQDLFKKIKEKYI